MPRHRIEALARDLLEVHNRIRCVEDESAQYALLEELLHPSRPYIVSFVNAHAANLGWRSHAVVENLLSSDLLLRDGIGMELGLRFFGQPHGMNMNGTDFIPKIARGYAGRRVALFGTCSPWLDTARQKLEADGVLVVACHHGFSPPETYLEMAADTKPDLVILAMGMPKQEELALRLRDRLTHPVLIVNGGAILDFLGDKVARAPEVMRKNGTEWLYRLYLEPARLARRYLVGIPAFFLHVAVTRFVRARLAQTGSRSP